MQTPADKRVVVAALSLTIFSGSMGLSVRKGKSQDRDRKRA